MVAPKGKTNKKVPPPPVPQKPKINEKKIPKKYQLTVLRDGIYEPISEDDWKQFQQEHPQIAKYFDSEDPNVVQEIQY